MQAQFNCICAVSFRLGVYRYLGCLSYAGRIPVDELCFRTPLRDPTKTYLILALRRDTEGSFEDCKLVVAVFETIESQLVVWASVSYIKQGLTRVIIFNCAEINCMRTDSHPFRTTRYPEALLSAQLSRISSIPFKDAHAYNTKRFQ